VTEFRIGFREEIDDHIVFIEHPSLPEHWRRVPR
jgi:hypothetical protein